MIQPTFPRDGIRFSFSFLFFFLLSHCGRMSERSKESPAVIGYLSIYVYAYILGMTRNAARLIENINDFSRFFPRTNDTYASGYWYIVQDTWQLDVSAKNVWKPLSRACISVCATPPLPDRFTLLLWDLKWASFRDRKMKIFPSLPYASTSEWKYSGRDILIRLSLFATLFQVQLVSPSNRTRLDG